MGSIELIVGPMFSGKSSELMRRVRRLKAANKSYLIIVPEKDNRHYGEEEVMSTNDKLKLPAKKVASLSEITSSEIASVSTIVIDEGQFFSNIATYVDLWAVTKNKNIIIAALNGTSERKPFPEISPLYALASHISHLQAICTMCFKEGSYSKRLTEESGMFVIGGIESYTARCLSCFEL